MSAHAAASGCGRGAEEPRARGARGRDWPGSALPTRAIAMIATLLLATLATCAPAQAATPAAVRASHIVVDKAARRLSVYAGDTLLASYAVALGGNPLGHKTREGDRRTPEGDYVLDYKNAASAYYRSIHISYPNAADRRQARARGVAPGGDIMIHGQPNNAAFRAWLQLNPGVDWTDGCIALSDADMQALWERVRVPLPIRINP